MQEKQLPEGFALASDLPREEHKWEPEPPEAFERPKPKREEDMPVKVESLREALEVFKYRVDATKLDDVVLGGIRVGALFRRDSDDEKYMVTFKRDFYYHFSKHFMHVKEQGYGVLSNVKLVYWAALEGINIAAIFPDGRCYWVDGMEFYKYYEENETECPHVKGEIASPLSMWKRLF
jgi:hypothetical protein